MRRIVAGITSLEEHLEMIRHKPEAYRPLSCPHFGIKQLRQHGYCCRKAERRAATPDRPGADQSVLLRRLPAQLIAPARVHRPTALVLLVGATGGPVAPSRRRSCRMR
jgi:hypothetical protein